MESICEKSTKAGATPIGNGFVIENGIIRGEEKNYPALSESMAELILKTFNKASDHVAQIDALTGKKRTYKELKERTIRLAIWLEKEGIRAGDVICLCSSSHFDIDTVIITTLLIGAAYNGLPHDLNLESAQGFINHTKPRIVFTSKSNASVLQKAADLENHKWKMIVLGDDYECSPLNDILMAQSPEEVQNFQIQSRHDPTDPCIIMPTSGTTGVPKFVCFSYEAYMLWISTIYADSEKKHANRVTLSYLYPEWAVHFRYFLTYFLDGSTQIFHADFEPYDTCRVIEKYKVNTLTVTTYQASLLAQAENVCNKYNLESVTLLISLGAKLYTAFERKLRKIFLNTVIGRGLGSSETQILTGARRKGLNPKSEGTVQPNVQLKIVDPITGSTLGKEQVGEICAKTPYIMTGYYKNAAATKTAFDAEGWFHTGDEGYYDENGEIFIVGRLKEVIRFRHTDYHPADIEQILLSHPDIMDAAIVAIPHKVDYQHPVAFVKSAPGSNVTEEDILKLTRDLKYSDTFEDSVIFVDEIPRSTNGKIKRRELEERAEKFYAYRLKDF